MDNSMSINKERMDPYMKATHTKRFVVEDSITKVTSDGEPHEMMTMIAGLSGLFAAMVILAVLVSLVSCKSGKKVRHCKNCPRTANGKADNTIRTCSLVENSTRSSISTTYTRGTSLEEGNSMPPTPIHNPSVSVISSGNLSGNLNSAFMDNELNLTNTLSKPKKKKTHWIDEVNAQVHIKETAVDIERF